MSSGSGGARACVELKEARAWSGGLLVMNELRELGLHTVLPKLEADAAEDVSFVPL